MAKEESNEKVNQELADLQAEIARLQEERDNAVKERDSALTVNDDLQKKLEETEATVDKVMIVVTHNKKKYKVAAKQFQFGEEVYKAEDLKKNADIVKALIEKKSGLLIPIS